MKRLTRFIIVVLMLVPTFANAQDAGQLLITSYTRAQPFYICNGSPSTGAVNIHYAFVNAEQSKPLHVDSVHFVCDKSQFILLDDSGAFDVGISSLTVAGYYPTRAGIDTLTIIGYYGPYQSIAHIVCRAIESPPIAFYGVETLFDDVGGGIKIGGSDEVLTTDTLHDDFGWMYVSDTALDVRRYSLNPSIIIKSCGDRTIDRIYRVGDSSEIAITGIPVLPFSMHQGDKLTLDFTLTPKIVGKNPHYLVIHTTDDDYLVWSFEYDVYAKNEVRPYNAASDVLDGGVFPNPISGSTGTLELIAPTAGTAHLRLLDLSGRTVMNLPDISFTIGSTLIPIPTESLRDGTYLVLIESPDGAISRKLVIDR